MDFGPLSAALAEGYRLVVEASGWFARPRMHVEFVGPDRASFLHNFCTAEIRKLPVGRGCEAFVTTVQGKVLDFVTVFAGAESLTVSGMPGGGARLVAHLDRYLIREKVELHDRSDAWAELVLAGPQAPGVLAALGAGALPGEPWGEAMVDLAGQSVRVRRISELNVPAYALVMCSSGVAGLVQALAQAGASEVDRGLGEILRIEAGFPAYGQDITEKNLPQEVDRDDRAISFTKGCYLGQETVARIDALGHVNRTLCRLQFAGPVVPAAGTALEQQGQAVGEVTSAAWSPRAGAALGLGYLRRGHITLGASFTTATGGATLRPSDGV